jgi:hypothetical protein
MPGLIVVPFLIVATTLTGVVNHRKRDSAPLRRATGGVFLLGLALLGLALPVMI